MCGIGKRLFIEPGQRQEELIVFPEVLEGKGGPVVNAAVIGDHVFEVRRQKEPDLMLLPTRIIDQRLERCLQILSGLCRMKVDLLGQADIAGDRCDVAVVAGLLNTLDGCGRELERLQEAKEELAWITVLSEFFKSLDDGRMIERSHWFFSEASLSRSENLPDEATAKVGIGALR